jgi:hypothetical protein
MNRRKQVYITVKTVTDRQLDRAENPQGMRKAPPVTRNLSFLKEFFSG